MKKTVKILGFSFLGLIIFSMIIAAIFGDKKTASNSKVMQVVQFNKDSLVSIIKKDSLYKVTSVEITADSTINIHLKDPEVGADQYFENDYKLLKGGYIQEIAIFKKDKFYCGQGYHTAAFVKQFEDNYMIGGECEPVHNAIKNKLNDPDSYEHVSTGVLYTGDGNFEITTKFRGKNAFNATITQIATATVSADGTILSLDLK